MVVTGTFAYGISRFVVIGRIYPDQSSQIRVAATTFGVKLSATIANSGTGCLLQLCYGRCSAQNCRHNLTLFYLTAETYGFIV